MNHRSSVFANSCLRTPVDPISKMPKTAYERGKRSLIEQSSIDSCSVTCVSPADEEAEKLKDFYQSIPDYNDINHLPTEQFYLTLRSLREKKKLMLGLAVDHIDHNGCNNIVDNVEINIEEPIRPLIPMNSSPYKSYSNKEKQNDVHNCRQKSASDNKSVFNNNGSGTSLKQSKKLCVIDSVEKSAVESSLKPSAIRGKAIISNERPKRNQSACSISWNDAKVERKDDVDEKFDKYFEGKTYSKTLARDLDDEFRTHSMPSSPLRNKRFGSPSRRRRGITVPRPFKMTERDEEERVVNELRSLKKSFSDDMLHVKCTRKQFRANPVPIESRIPLYDKILEDQAMRRAITKINSEAELRAQMKPFSFTKREETSVTGVCDRATPILPKMKKKKRFKARPVPKNLFSNYFYDRKKEDEFFRSMNRRIRAEELLRNAQFPGNMAARERSRLSTPAAHSDLPIDPSPVAPSTTSSDPRRSTSPTKEPRRRKVAKENFITTSPQPFRFNTADRAAKKTQEMLKKVYEGSKCTESATGSPGASGARALSALELRANVAGRSNLAALLRAETVRQRFEMEAARRLAEQRRRNEIRQRDKQLRSKPAWYLVKNNHEEDIAIRLQTRRDEERMRREEFLHEMELMHGRVQRQPMLFERYYAPRSYSLSVDCLELPSPRKSGKKGSKKKSYHYTSPNRSRKVSINDAAETYNGNIAKYLNSIENDDKLYSDSEVAIDSQR